MLDATEKTNSLRTFQKVPGEDGGDKIQITGGRETAHLLKKEREKMNTNVGN